MQNIYLIIIYLAHVDSALEYIEAYCAFWLMSLIIFLIKDAVLRYNLHFHVMSIEEKWVKKLNPQTVSMEKCKWKNLDVGSIIFLDNNEISPADILFLDSSDVSNKEAFCFVDSQLITGGRNLKKKKSSALTHANLKNPNKIRLSFKLEYSQPNPEYGVFVGYLKLCNDPKIEKLTCENFIPRGARIKKVSWIMGLVLYNGTDTKMTLNSKMNFHKTSFLDDLAQIYFLTFFCIVAICSFIGEIMYYSATLNALELYDQKSLHHIMVLTVMFPLDFYIISEIWLLFAKYRFEYKFKKKNQFLKINSPNLITNLSHVDYAIFDKTGSLTKNSKSLSLLYFKERGLIYEFSDYASFLEKFWLSSHNPNFIKSISNCFDANMLYPSFAQSKIIDSKTLIDEYNSNEGFNLFNGLLESIILTNSISCEYAKHQKTWKLKFRTKDEKIMNSFARHLEYEFLNYYKKEGCLYYTVRVKKHVYDYKILGFHEQESDLVYNLFTIIYEDPKKNNFVISCKGHASKLIKRLKFSKQDFENLDSILLNFNKKGFQDPLMYAKRILSQEEATDFFEKYNILQASLISQEDYLADLVNELLIDLELMGLAGLQEDLEPDSFELIKFLKSLSINSWILTGDNKQSAYNVVTRIGMFDEEAEQFCIESENYEDLVKQVKIILGSLNNSIKPNSQISVASRNNKSKRAIAKESVQLTTIFDEKFDKYMLINGKSFDLIQKDEYLFSNFLFACSLLRTVVGFNFSAQNKKQFVEIIKHKFSRKSTVMAIGHGFNDILMMNSADIGIEIAKPSKNQRELEINMMLGDIVLTNLRQVKQLMMNQTGVYFDRFKHFIELTYFKSFLYGYSLFNFAFFTHFSSNCFYDSLMTVFYFGFLNVPSQVLVLVFYKKFPNQIRDELPEIYHESKYQKKVMKIIKNLFMLIVEGYIISVSINLTILFSVTEIITPDGGYALNYNSLGFIYVYSLSIFVHAKAVIAISLDIRNAFMFFLVKFIMFCMIFLMISIIVLCDIRGITISENFKVETEQILKTPQILILIFSNVIVALLLSYLFNFVKKNWTFFQDSPYEKILPSLNINIPQPKKIIRTRTALKSFIFKKRKLTDLIKNFFKNPKFMDPIISYAIGLYDESAQKFHLNPFSLRFLDRRIQNLYDQDLKEISIKYAKIFLSILLLLFGTYALTNFIDNQNSPNIGQLLLFFAGFFFLVFMMIFPQYKKIHYESISFIFGVCILLKIIFDWTFTNYNKALSGIIIPIISGMSVHLKINFVHILIYNFFYYLSFTLRIILYFDDENFLWDLDGNLLSEKQLTAIRFSNSMNMIMAMGIITSICLAITYEEEKQKRLEFLSKQKISLESKLVQDILAMLVPKFVRTSMAEDYLGNSKFNEKHNVSILFCDISNFDEIISKEQENVVQILDTLFRHFDDLCFSFGVQKIETVGKTYMGCTGISMCELNIPMQILSINKTTRLVNMALEMMRFADNFTTSTGKKLKLKIGVHQGDVIAGVIGFHKPQFSLIGDTVNTTSRVCSTGESGEITLSEEAVKNLNTWLFHLKKKTVEAKGKGTLNVYQIKKRNKTIYTVRFQKITELIMSKIRTQKGFTKPIMPRHNSIMKVVNLLYEVRNEETPKNSLIKPQLINQEMFSLMESDDCKVKIDAKTTKMNFLKPLQKLFSVSNFGGNFRKKTTIIKIKPKTPSKIKSKKQDKKIDFPKKSSSSTKQTIFPSLKNDKDLIPIKGKGSFSEKSFFYFNYQRKSFSEFMKQLVHKQSFLEKIILFKLFLFSIVRNFLILALIDFFEMMHFVFFEGIFVACLGLVLLFSREFYNKIHKKPILKYILLKIFLLGFLASFFELLNSKIKQNYSSLLMNVVILHLVLANTCFVDVLVLSLILMLVWISSLYFIYLLTIENLAYPITIIALIGVKIYIKTFNAAKNFHHLKENEVKRRNQELFVSQLLPIHAFEKLKQIQNNNKVSLTDSFKNVTLLFADIVNFTKYSSSVTPNDVVQMLRELFIEFDKTCSKIGVYKVYTIGDCYVVLGFLNALTRNPLKEAINVINMGLSMIKIIGRVREKINFHELDMRIGVHTGDIIGGIVGKDIVRYDIYGKDVLIANKMESNGLMGHVMVSESTKNLIEREGRSPFSFRKYKDVEFKLSEMPIPAYLVANEKEYPSYPYP